jgi:putative ABC transport system substrate-binding protein
MFAAFWEGRMNNRRRLVIALGVATWSLAGAQQAKKTYRIGYLSGGSGMGPPEEAFRQRLRELGHVDAKNLVIEWHFLQGRADRAPAAAAELVRLNVDCIAAAGVGYIRAAMQATTSIPIVMTNVDADPVELGFIKSLARPGGNVTGFTGIGHDLAGKRLELLKELVPSAKRVGMLVGTSTGGPEPTGANLAHYRGTESAARKLGMEVRLLYVQTPEELETKFSRLADGRPDVLSVFSGGWFGNHHARIIDWVARMKLPAIYSNARFVDFGALMGYSDDPVHRLREVAEYVAKILSGAQPANLPVQQPTKFQLAINLRTAKALGITIPQTIMLRADRVIR